MRYRRRSKSRHSSDAGRERRRTLKRSERVVAAARRFDVTLAPGEPAALLRADEEDASRWSLMFDIDAGDDYGAGG